MGGKAIATRRQRGGISMDPNAQPQQLLLLVVVNMISSCNLIILFIRDYLL
jgi:hypothetical protein